MENANLQSNTSSTTVEQLALDICVDMTVAGSAAADSVVAGSAAMSGGDNVWEGQHTTQVLL